MAKINLDDYYPPSAKNVPEDLTQPTAEYKRRVVLVLISVLVFFLFYLALTIGSLLACIFALVLLGPFGIVVSIPSLLFFLFLVKGFFKRRDQERTTRVEVTAEDEPLLFAFLERICEETGASMPRHVYVSHDLTASVMTPATVLSLFWPVGQDLDIGLGRVASTNLSEIKSTLSHEFGHFSQKSTRLGAYVYVAHNIIIDLVAGRDWFDRMIEGWCRLDVRIAWMGWALYGVVWLMRKVLEGFFFLIHLMHRSLSRQMELNADLVSVAVAGSDARVHSLFRYKFAEEVWTELLKDLGAATDHKLYTADLYYHFNHTANYLRKKHKDPKRGIPPPLAEDPCDTPDLFKPGEDDDDHDPWSTHPSLYEREQNAKEYYIRCPIDDRSAWVLFRDPQKLREDVTYLFYRAAGYKKRQLEEAADPAEVQAFIDGERAETTYDVRYHGLYDDRYIEIEDVQELITEADSAGWNEGRLERVAAKLYDNELKEWMDGYTARREEYRLLTGLASGELELKGEDLEFRGRKYDVEEAKRLLKKVDKELEEDRQYFEGLDRRAFLVFYQMATQLGDKSPRELADRYDFHLTCQGMLRKIINERSHLEAALAFLSGKQELQQHEFKAALKAFRDAHKALKKSLDTADDLPLPELANMKKGKPLGYFLLEKRLVHSLDRDENTLRGDWINRFMAQLTEVLEKLRRIHFKSLGGILILQDRIFQRWREQLAAMPTVEAISEDPRAAAKPAGPPAARPVAAPPAKPGAVQPAPRPVAQPAGTVRPVVPRPATPAAPPPPKKA
jgi:Zn-dependent protease with chaperone function